MLSNNFSVVKRDGRIHVIANYVDDGVLPVGTGVSAPCPITY